MINVAPAVAQADCHLIEFPDGQKAIIDIADGADAPGRALAYLRERGITHVNLVVISHFHKDHYGRLRDLIEAGIRVDRVAGNVPDPVLNDTEHPWGYDWPDVKSLLQFLHVKGVPYFTPKAGERLIDASTNGVPIHLVVVSVFDGLHTPIGKTDVNDTSIILRLTHGTTRALFSGDLNYRMGMYLATHNFDLSADILKVPHHGTEGAAPNEFFEQVNPKIALVPSPKALWWSIRSKRIRTFFHDHQIPTYVSGIDGNVTVTLRADGFAVETGH